MRLRAYREERVMSAPIDRKGRDVRTGKHEDRIRREETRWESDRIRRALEAGMSPNDIER